MNQTRGRVAGALAAAVALAVTEVVTAGAGPSLIDSIGTEFINRFAAPIKDLAIELFGTNDKLALEIGIVVVALLVGSALGRASVQRRVVGLAGIGAFGVLGLLAGFNDPLASAPRAALAAVLGTAAGIATLVGLLRAAEREATPSHEDPGPNKNAGSRNTDPTVRVGDRRSFLMLAGVTGAVAVAGAASARALRAGADGAGRIARIALPRAKRTTPLPVSQPFAPAGISPYITPNADFYRIDTALFVPRVNETNWKLEVNGMVERPFTISYEDLLGMDMVEEPVTLQCVSNEVGGDLVGNASWLGVPLVDLLNRAGVKSDADQIVGRSVDDFTAGFPTAAAFDGRTALVAVGMNGEPLPQQHGFPARLVVAGLYGYVSATKWLKQIELTRFDDFEGYWIPRGWAAEAPIKIASRIDVPRLGDNIAPGPVVIAGVAWAPPDGISRVEISVDDGPWLETKLGEVASGNTWVQWMTTWTASAGKHEVKVRAFDTKGRAQTADEANPRPDGATGHHRRSFFAK